MKIATIAGAFLLGIASAATANAESASSESAFDWAGPYVGINLGYGWGGSNFVDSDYNGVGIFPTVRWDTSSDGFLAGINAGYNWRRDRVVFGLEGEIGHMNLSGGKMQPGVDPFGVPYDASGTVDKGWYGGLSARLGYAWDRTLVYAKAGVVYSGAKLGFVDTCTVAPCGNSTANASKRAGWGYQLGAGVEHALSNRWTVKAEYAYLDFGHVSIRGRGVGGGFDGDPFNTRADLSVHTVKIGLNYKF